MVGFDEDNETNVNPILQNSVMYLMLTYSLITMYSCYQIYSGMSGMELVGVHISRIFVFIGIIYGHELDYTKGFSFGIILDDDQWFCSLLLCTCV